MSRRSPRALLGIGGAVLLAVFLLLALATPALGFTDVPDTHPYARAINGLATMGIIGGYEDGSFGPNNTVTRAQFAKMIIGAFGIDPGTSTATRFTDLGSPNADGYPHKYVQAAYENGITKGTNAAQTLFSPGSPIRRDQVVSMIVRGAQSIGGDMTLVDHVPAGAPTWFAGVGEPHGANLRTAEFNGLLYRLVGMGASWSPTANATRGEVAQMLWDLIPGDYTVLADGTGDYPTIEAAVAAVGPRDRIHLGPGTFTLEETLSVSYPLTIVGVGIGDDQRTAVTYAGTVLEADSTLLVAMGILFVSTTTSLDSNAVRAGDCFVILEECGFAGGNRVDRQWGSGLFLYGTTLGTVSSCVATLNDLSGVQLEDAADVIIQDCGCFENGESGIAFLGRSRGLVIGNTLFSNGYHGVGVQGEAEATIEENDCYENTECGIAVQGDATAEVVRNTCHSNGKRGISVHDNANATVEDNECSGNAQAGIAFFQSSTGSVSNNECANNKWGLYVGAAATPVIGTNNLHGNTYNLVEE